MMLHSRDPLTIPGCTRTMSWPGRQRNFDVNCLNLSHGAWGDFTAHTGVSESKRVREEDIENSFLAV